MICKKKKCCYILSKVFIALRIHLYSIPLIYGRSNLAQGRAHCGQVANPPEGQQSIHSSYIHTSVYISIIKRTYISHHKTLIELIERRMTTYFCTSVFGLNAKEKQEILNNALSMLKMKSVYIHMLMQIKFKIPFSHLQYPIGS